MAKYEIECSKCFTLDRAETYPELENVMANHICQDEDN